MAGDDPLVLVNHWPLLRIPTRVMTHLKFPHWCNTEMPFDSHTSFGVRVVVYGHLLVPRLTIHGGVQFEEVSVGYPREWQQFGLRNNLSKLILGGPAA